MKRLSKLQIQLRVIALEACIAVGFFSHLDIGNRIATLFRYAISAAESSG